MQGREETVVDSRRIILSLSNKSSLFFTEDFPCSGWGYETPEPKASAKGTGFYQPGPDDKTISFVIKVGPSLERGIWSLRLAALSDLGLYQIITVRCPWLVTVQNVTWRSNETQAFQLIDFCIFHVANKTQRDFVVRGNSFMWKMNSLFLLTKARSEAVTENWTVGAGQLRLERFIFLNGTKISLAHRKLTFVLFGNSIKCSADSHWIQEKRKGCQVGLPFWRNFGPQKKTLHIGDKEGLSHQFP